MQLILDSEPALAIEKDMSTAENTQAEKVGNGAIGELKEKNCIGNKENIGDVNCISDEDITELAINEDSPMTSLPVDKTSKSGCKDKETTQTSTVESITCVENSCAINNAPEESHKIDTEKICGTDVLKSEIDNEPSKILQVDSQTNEGDIFSSKDEHLNQIFETVGKELENIVPKNDATTGKKQLPITKDSVDLTETPTEGTIPYETIKDIGLEEITKEPEPSDTKELKHCKNYIDNKPLCKSQEVVSCNVSSNEQESVPIKLKDDMCEDVFIEENKINKQDIITEAIKDTPCKNNNDNTTVSKSPEVVSCNDEQESVPIKLKDKMDEDVLVEETKSKKPDTITEAIKDTPCKNDRDNTTVCEFPKVVSCNDEQESVPIELKDDMDEDVLVEETKSEKPDTITEAIKDTPCKNDSDNTPVCRSPEVVSCNDEQESVPIELKDEMDEDILVEETKSNEQDTINEAIKDSPPVNSIKDKPILCKLSNTLDILSDDDEEPPKKEPPVVVDANEKQCINIEDDDDIMLIDEDTSKTETQTSQPENVSNKEAPLNTEVQRDSETGLKINEDTTDLFAKTDEKESTLPTEIKDSVPVISINEKEEKTKTKNHELPLLPDNFLKTAKKNLSDMTREELEEFCILKIVESIVDRSNLSEIKNKLKTMAQGIEEYRKKAMMLTKQNRDLQVVLKSVQEEQKKMTPGTAITPLKITRSVGMQVFMEKSNARRKSLAQLQNTNNNNTANRQNVKNAPTPSPRPQKPPAPNQSIPVPRLVPANNPAMKTPSTLPLVNQIAPSKTASPVPNGIKTPSSSQKVAEKRQHNRIMSVTVDLTDDEPPAKINNRTSPAPPVRLVPSQNLLASPARQPFGSSISSPRKVYIPISGPQNQGLRPGQTIMLKTVPTPGLKPRGPTPQISRLPSGTVRVNRIQPGRHPAPLPDAMKQYQPPNWKALPPAPDLKLSKVENGIVISWKIEGYQEDSYEEIASYQLYAYQETSSPASTALWKKIGDVKALPLPMACTLTQFMAGFKYYFAVRAVDIRSRLGPFSLPGSILLLNKL